MGAREVGEPSRAACSSPVCSLYELDLQSVASTDVRRSTDAACGVPPRVELGDSGEISLDSRENWTLLLTKVG